MEVQIEVPVPDNRDNRSRSTLELSYYGVQMIAGPFFFGHACSNIEPWLLAHFCLMTTLFIITGYLISTTRPAEELKKHYLTYLLLLLGHGIWTVWGQVFLVTHSSSSCNAAETILQTWVALGWVNVALQIAVPVIFMAFAILLLLVLLISLNCCGPRVQMYVMTWIQQWANIQPPFMNRATDEAIADLPRVQVLEPEEVDCPICLETYVQGQTKVQLPCQHEFHEECVVEWLKINGNCPNCRERITPDELDPENPSPQSDHNPPE